MTKPRNRHHKRTGGLKALLLTASVIATIGGARLLALQESVPVNPDSERITIVETARGASVSTSAASNRRMTLELKPIPQAMVPHINPIARAQSSM